MRASGLNSRCVALLEGLASGGMPPAAAPLVALPSSPFASRPPPKRLLFLVFLRRPSA